MDQSQTPLAPAPLPQKTPYLDMIQEALSTLRERQGSSRQAIWKCVHCKHPEADYKQFLVRLKKFKAGSTLEEPNKGRYRLTQQFKQKLLDQLKKGKSGKRVLKTKATTKKLNQHKKASVKPRKSHADTTADKPHEKKKQTDKTPKRQPPMLRRSKGPKPSSKNGKAKGTRKVQEKRNAKRELNQKRAKLNKEKNSRKGQQQKIKPTLRKRQQIKAKSGSKDGTGISSKRHASKMELHE